MMRPGQYETGIHIRGRRMINRIKRAALILAVVPEPALAIDLNPASPVVELWNGFTTASTAADVKAFKATKLRHKVEVYPGCEAEMGYRQDDGRLVTIIFLGRDRDGSCFARMYADQLRDHGQPETKGTTFGSGIGFGTGAGVAMVDMTSPGTLLIWRDGEKKTKLVKTPGGGYNLIFTVRPDKFIY